MTDIRIEASDLSGVGFLRQRPWFVGVNPQLVDLVPAVISLPILDSRYRADLSKTKKKTVHDIILQTAKKYVLESGQNKFTGAKLFNLSLVQHPGLKRNTFAARVIAAAPNHPSHRHSSNRKDYFTYQGKGFYKLNQKYLGIPADQIMPPSDQVRNYVKRKYIDPAKKAGKKSSSKIEDDKQQEALDLVDILVYDIQDIGVRSYTYISTMGLVMEAAAEMDKEVLILDRPNPLGGIRVEGPLVEDGFHSFVSQHSIPYVYGLTCGELAMMLNGEGMLEE